MLYEVITNPKVTGEVVVIIALKMRHTGTDANVVITSYSIHYTKLYDAANSQAISFSGQLSLHPSVARVEADSIYSEGKDRNNFV